MITHEYMGNSVLSAARSTSARTGVAVALAGNARGVVENTRVDVPDTQVDESTGYRVRVWHPSGVRHPAEAETYTSRAAAVEATERIAIALCAAGYTLYAVVVLNPSGQVVWTMTRRTTTVTVERTVER